MSEGDRLSRKAGDGKNGANSKGPPTPKQGSKAQVLALLVAVIILAAGGAGIYLYNNSAGHEGYVPGGGNGTSGGNMAEDFKLVDTEGQTFGISQNKGSVLVLDFMATWCEPCKQQIAELKTVYAEYASRGVKVLSIDVDSTDTVAHLQQYKIERGATWQFALDKSGVAIMSDYSATSIPMIVIINKAGELVHRGVGLETASELSGRISPLL
jgi:peroxiredoxin